MPSLFNALLGTRFPRMSKVLFGIDADPGAGSLAPEIMPVAELLNPPIEGRWAAGEKVAALTQIVSNVAGEFGYVGVRNPAGSGMICVARLLVTETTASAAYFIRLNNTDPTRTLDAGIISTDLRWSVALSNATVCRVILGTEAASTGTNVARFFQEANKVTVWPIEYVLPPGTNVVVVHGTANTAFTGGVWFRERPARPDELA